MFEFVAPSDIKYQIVFGLDPHAFEHSTINPMRVQKITTANDEAHQKAKKSRCCFKVHTYDSISHDDMRPWTDKIIISSDDSRYENFNFCVQLLCLFSSFYYGSIAGIRYSEYDSFSTKNLVIMCLFEIIFSIHMLMQFLVSYKIDGDNEVRDLPMICNHYIYGQFLPEVIPCIPL